QGSGLKLLRVNLILAVRLADQCPGGERTLPQTADDGSHDCSQKRTQDHREDDGIIRIPKLLAYVTTDEIPCNQTDTRTDQPGIKPHTLLEGGPPLQGSEKTMEFTLVTHDGSMFKTRLAQVEERGHSVLRPPFFDAYNPCVIGQINPRLAPITNRR